jgi:hypothetical protein
MTTDQIVAEFYIEGTTGGAAVGNIAVLNLDGNVGNVLRGDGTWGVGGGGGSANVAGANGQLQYNSNGALAAVTGVSTDGVKLTVNTVANLSITGGSNGQMLTTDGSGNLRFATVPGYVNVPRIDLVSPNVYTDTPSWTNPAFAYYKTINEMSIFINGVLSDPTYFTLNGTTLTFLGGMNPDTGVDILQQAVALGNTDMSGNINAFDITCNSISGDGSRLTNLNAGTKISNTTTSVNTFSTGNVDITINGADIVNVDSGGMEVNGKIVPAANITYDLGSPTRRWRDLYLSNNTINLGNVALSADANGLSIGGETALTAPAGVLTVDTVNANHLSGNGSGITYISGANVYGAVDDAVYANVAGVAGVANLVEYSNIANIGNIASVNLDGNVSNVLLGDGSWTAKSDDANYANFAGVANIANIANTANTANVAKSVAVANVTGIGNIATINLDGNVSNVLAGDGSFVKLNAAPGNTTQLLFNNGGNIDAVTTATFDGTTIDITGSGASNPLRIVRYSNSATALVTVGRGRGTPIAPVALAVNDGIGGFTFPAYTGNGNLTINGVGGFSGVNPTVVASINGLPTSSGGAPSTSLNFNVTSNANASLQLALGINSDKSTQLFGNLKLSSGSNRYVPTTATDTGTAGQITWDGTYIYICINANTWQRVQHATW